MWRAPKVVAPLTSFALAGVCQAIARHFCSASNKKLANEYVDRSNRILAKVSCTEGACPCF